MRMAERPTIALVAHGVHDHGGMERAFFELVQRGHRDYDFVVFASELDERLRPLVDWRRIRVPMRPIPLKIAFFSLFAGLRLARTKKTLVHTMGAVVPNRTDVATVQFCSAGFRERTGLLVSPGRTFPRRINSGIVRLLALALEWWCYRVSRVRSFGAVSRGVAHELERHYPDVPVSITPNGVDVSRFRPDPDARRELRAQHGVGDDELVLLFVGNDWEHKGLAFVIEAIARAGLDRARLWVVGGGDEERYGALARAHGVSIRFAGRVRDTERWYAAADAFVFPTLYETFSLVAYEAAAAGLPVVATRVSGIDELLEDEQAGLLVEREAESIASALRRRDADPALRRRLGAEGRRRATHYGWGRSVDAVLQLYRELGSRA
jgi:UDP-glucose:(heptosyl)LPS alpha-1,3-glucosyltransferase